MSAFGQAKRLVKLPVDMKNVHGANKKFIRGQYGDSPDGKMYVNESRKNTARMGGKVVRNNPQGAALLGGAAVGTGAAGAGAAYAGKKKISKSAWGVVHKALPGATMGSAARAASIKVKPKTARMDSAFPKPGSTGSNFKPKSAKANPSQPFPGTQAPSKNGLKTSTKVGAAGAGGAAAGVGGTAMFDRNISKALYRGAPNLANKARKAGRSAGELVRQAPAKANRTSTDPTPLGRAAARGKVKVSRIASGTAANVGAAASRAKTQAKYGAKSAGQAAKVGAVKVARDKRTYGVAGGTAVGAGAGYAATSGIKRKKLESNTGPNRYGF